MATFIHEKNITVFAHDLYNQSRLDMISNFVFIGNCDFHNTVIFDLLDRLNQGTLQILSQNHDKSGRLGWIFKGCLGQLDATKNGMSREEQAMALAIAADLQDQLLFKRLIDFLDATIDQLSSQFLNHVV
ncbi:hypothetical protein D8834_04305 [Streptococcus oralis]|nr:hypothetical protein D8834_04305 [Streptococcus oralis]